MPTPVNGGIYSGIAAMDSAQRRLEAITSNLANLSSTGYKRLSTSTQSFQASLRGKLEPQISTRTVLDFSQGVLRNTGNPYDLALHGSGFFAVETSEGEVYTRNGQFRVDAEGLLQTIEGYPVAWDGARGTIDPLGVEVSVDEEGLVRQGDVEVGRLRIVDFEETGRLEFDRKGFYHASGSMRETTSTAVVRQGTLEGANVSAVDEMVAMIATQRSFESASKLMQTIEQSYRRLTRAR
jgi:flagellar basal-body rod protein FlgF